MNNTDALNIAIAETSAIVRCGLTALLKRMPNQNIHPIEIASAEALQNYLHMHTPDILVVNPTFGGWFNPAACKEEHAKLADVKFVAIVYSVIDNNLLRDYDEHLSICDDTDLIFAKFNQLLHNDNEEEGDNGQEALSQREKEIVTCIVKGMTNKAIAEKLFLSIHTVITHRRNIARKLQIHSPAGLTIYAIVNKLVELKEINLDGVKK